MTSNHNKELIAEQASWIEEMIQHGPDDDQRDMIYDAASFGSEGHMPPAHDDVYTVDKKTGGLKFCVDKFISWSEGVSGERFVSTGQGDDVGIYKDGVYTSHVKGWFKTAMNICNHNADVSIHYTREVMNRLGANMIVDRMKIDTQNTDLTVLNNCILNTQTCETFPHTPDYIAFSKLMCDYDPEAICPEWMEFLDYALPKHEQETLQELFGYTLVRVLPTWKRWKWKGCSYGNPARDARRRKLLCGSPTRCGRKILRTRPIWKICRDIWRYITKGIV